MDLKSKRLVGISQVIIFAAMLILYTRIGGMGMICVAGSMELFLVITYLFFGGIPDAMEYMIRVREKRDQRGAALMVRKAGILYGVLATVLAEITLVLVNKLLVEPSSLIYVDKMLELLMAAVPLLAVLQVLRGVLQVDLDRVVTGISRLVFVICMVIGMAVSYFILDDYGTKVAALMQSIRKWHFYVVLGLVPGVILGALGSIAFLVMIGVLRREQIKLLHEQQERSSESILKLCGKLFVTQLTRGVTMWLKHVPLLVLLCLSMGEIAGENYLFGNFYGAVLPLFGLLWSLSDLGLVTYKKRLYAAYRRKLGNQYYKDLKAVLCYVLLHSVAIFAFTLALHKSYLAIWSLQTFVAFMKLAAASAVIGLLGLPCIVFLDVLKYRNLQKECVVSVAAGAVVSVIAALICYRTAGAGILMYVLCISLQLAVTVLVAAWNLSAIVGINYLSVAVRSAGGVAVTLILGLLAFAAQKMLFTALGGLTTLLLCAAVGLVLQLIAVLIQRIFEKEELTYFPLSVLTKRI